MIRCIHLKNFKTFEDEYINISPLTLIMGLNGMGKSSILQSLLLLKQNFANGSFDMPQKQVRLEGDFVHLECAKSLNYTWAEDYEVEVGLTLDDGIDRNWVIDVCEEEKSDLPCKCDLIDDKVREVFADSFVFIEADRLIPQKKYNVISARTYNTKLGVNGELTPSYLHEALNKNEMIGIDAMKCEGIDGLDTQLVSNVNAWMSRIMSMEMSATTQKVGQEVKLSYTIGEVAGDSFSPLQVGFGLTYTLPIVTAVLMAKPGDLLLMENPEAHLHPSAQVNLGFMFAKAVANGVQIVVETHSDHIINGVRLARKENVLSNIDDAKLIFIEREKKENRMLSSVSEVKINDNGMYTNPLPKMFNTWTDTLVKLV